MEESVCEAKRQRLEKERRREKNRESAQRSRQRKKERVEALTLRLQRLETENLELRLKLKVGREHVKHEHENATELIKKIKDMIGFDGGKARDEEIRQEITALQDRFSDYGRDRSSSFAFHMHQLHRSLQPTNTTRVMLHMLSLAPQFLHDDGTDRAEPLTSDEGVKKLWFSLLDALQPSDVQRRHLVVLNDPDSSPLPRLRNAAAETTAVLDRLGDLVSDKNTSLDAHMRTLSDSLTATQVAKFICWVEGNRTLLQLVGQLMGPVFAGRPSDGGGDLGTATATDENVSTTPDK